MNNMAHKRRRWAAWERYVRYCLRFRNGGPKWGTGGMRAYGNQRMSFHNRRVDRQNAAMLTAIGEITGLTPEQLGIGGSG